MPFGSGKPGPWDRFAALGQRAELDAAFLIATYGFLKSMVTKLLITPSVAGLSAAWPSIVRPEVLSDPQRQSAMNGIAVAAVLVSSEVTEIALLPIAKTILLGLPRLAAIDAPNAGLSDDPAEAFLQMVVRWADILEADDPRFWSLLHSGKFQEAFGFIRGSWLAGTVEGMRREGVATVLTLAHVQVDGLSEGHLLAVEAAVQRRSA